MFKAAGRKVPKVLSVLLVALMPLLGVVATAPAAHAVQSFNNALVADMGLLELGTSRPTGYNQPGECIKSVQRWVANAGGYFGGGGVVSGYINSGAQEVTLASAVKGDVIQYTAATGNVDDNWSHVHTVVVIDNLGNSRFNIVQSNSPAGSGLVTRVDNWTPMPASGWVSRVWRFGTVNVSTPPPAPPQRIGVMSNGSLDVKEGPVNAMWTTVGGGQSFKLSPSRVVVYGQDANGNYELVAKEGSLGATWAVLTGAVDEYEVTDTRVGIRIGDTLYVKEGGLGAMWQPIASRVASFEMSPNRIAAVVLNQQDQPELLVKEGPLNAMWATVTGAVDDFKVTDNRVGVRVGTQVAVKEGALNATWVTVINATSFQMSPNRIAAQAVDPQGQPVLMVKEGPVNATWSTITGAVDDFRVTDSRVGIMVGGQLHIKDGPLGAMWTHVGGGSVFALAG